MLIFNKLWLKIPNPLTFGTIYGINYVYSNMNVDLTQTPNKIHYKRCETTYNEKLKELIDSEQVSLRGLKDNAKVFDELVFDIN